MRGLGALGLLAAAGGLAVACQGPTSITIEVTTDALCTDVRGVSIASSSQQATENAPPATTTSKCGAAGGGNRIGSLTILPSGRDDAEIGIKVVAGIDVPVEQCDPATGYKGCIVARRWIRFQPGVELVLPIALHLDCKSVACDATSTCVRAGLCKSAKVASPSGCTGDDCLDPTPVVPDAGAAPTNDTGPYDTGSPEDTSREDTGPVDTGPAETTPEDTSTADTEAIDTAVVDSSVEDTAVVDSGAEDTTVIDSTVIDSTVIDSTVVDSTVIDSTVEDSSFGDTTVVDTTVEDTSFGDTSVVDSADASVVDSFVPDTGPTCTATEKSCDGKCVAIDDPAYGCGAATCSPCDPATHETYTCTAGACSATGCVAGYKACSGACVPTDADHGCSGVSCDACPSANGIASCAAGACKLTCNSGYKLCGGKCVNIGDPTYGCGLTTCDATSCPSTGGGTLICSGYVCTIGSCGPGTKACAGTCVPMDSTHGCGDVTRCTACAAGESCVGGPPTTCQCVAEAKSVTCSKVQCGVTRNNCGTLVDCGNSACALPSYCGGGGVPNVCGCTPIGTPCDGVNCGTFTDSCGKPVDCGCISPKSCGGAGIAGKCGCSPMTCDLYKCGDFEDGCGGKITCGCKTGQTCGGGGEPGICGCKELPPEEVDKQCAIQKELGVVCPTVDNCGKIYDCICGTGGEKCCANTCICPECTCK